MNIYRIEHNVYGFGPYCSIGRDTGRRAMLQRHNSNSHRYPCAIEDGIKMSTFERQGLKYGFATLLQLKEWFTQRELDMLYSYNFSIVEYIVDKVDIYFGKHQIVFDSEKAEKVQSLPNLR